MEKYQSSYSKSILVSTILFSGLVLAICCFLVIKLLHSPLHSNAFLLNAIVLAIVVAAFVHAFLSQIKYIALTDKEVIIKRMCGQVVIPRNEIVRVQRKHKIMRDVRVWGIGGLFGHIGRFWSAETGNYQAYVNNGQNMIEIKTTKSCYVASCDECGKVLGALSKA